MNHCESYEPLLDAFTEGDLFMEDMVRVQQHLNNCPDCQAYVDDLLAIRAAFPTVEETEVPAGFTANVMAAVAATPQAAASKAAGPAAKTAQKNAPWVKVLSGLAACCAIVLLAQGGLKMAAGGGSMAPGAESAPAEAPETILYIADTVTEEAAIEEEAPAPEAKAAQPEAESAGDRYTNQSISPEGAAPAEGSGYRIVIRVDAAYIGSLLDPYTPMEELGEADGGDPDGSLLKYELTLAEYEALLDQLADRGEMPAEEVFDTASQTVLVIVRQ